MPMTIAIGEPHPVLVGKHVTEGTVLSIAPDDFGIYAILDHPNTREIQQSQTAGIRIGLAPAGDHTFFLILKPGGPQLDRHALRTGRSGTGSARHVATPRRQRGLPDPLHVV